MQPAQAPASTLQLLALRGRERSIEARQPQGAAEGPGLAPGEPDQEGAGIQPRRRGPPLRSRGGKSGGERHLTPAGALDPPARAPHGARGNRIEPLEPLLGLAVQATPRAAGREGRSPPPQACPCLPSSPISRSKPRGLREPGVARARG